MLKLFEGYNGKLVINGKEFNSAQEAIIAFKDFKGKVVVELFPEQSIGSDEPIIEEKDTKYVIKVKQYMTKPASPSFDFMDKWNNGVPMPMRIMVGKKLKETKGMVRMELRGEVIQEVNPVCMKCGRTLTNPISQYFGIGPECGGHNYISPFETDAELQQAIGETRKQLQGITWTGWIIKSAIEEQKIWEG